MKEKAGRRQWKQPEKKPKDEAKKPPEAAECVGHNHSDGQGHEQPKDVHLTLEVPDKKKKSGMKENVMPGTVPPPPDPEAPAVLDERDHRKLAKSNYEKTKEKFKTVFVIQHVRTKKVAELRAASSVHAAHLIGWRPRQCRLIKSYEEK
jgi:hypothetical protein